MNIQLATAVTPSVADLAIVRGLLKDANEVAQAHRTANRRAGLLRTQIATWTGNTLVKRYRAAIKKLEGTKPSFFEWLSGKYLEDTFSDRFSYPRRVYWATRLMSVVGDDRINLYGTESNNNKYWHCTELSEFINAKWPEENFEVKVIAAKTKGKVPRIIRTKKGLRKQILTRVKTIRFVVVPIPDEEPAS